MAIVLSELKPGTKLRTRGGHKVISWHTVEDSSSTFFPLRAVIEVAKGVTEEHPYNHNGRRYINTESELDLMVAQRRSKRRRVEPWPYDCMPEPLRAIVYIRAGEIDKVKLANKNYSTPATKGAITNIEIGCTE
jgi:hypothetical protein